MRMPPKPSLALPMMLTASLLPIACSPAPLEVRAADPEPPPAVTAPKVLTDPVTCPEGMTDLRCNLLTRSSFFS